MNHPSILVVDDEPDNFDVIESLLTDRGYNLHYAASGQEAIESLELTRPDVILMDVMMPGMSGVVACQQIRAIPQWKTTPIIIVTALTVREDLGQLMMTGADDFISKPVNGVELRARIHSMLHVKQQRDELQQLRQFKQDLSDRLLHDVRDPLTHILADLDTMTNLNLSREAQKAKISLARSRAEKVQVAIDQIVHLINTATSADVNASNSEASTKPPVPM